MAQLIQLKQIESSSALATAADVGSDFSQSVIDVVTGEVVGVLPSGVISGSTQLDGSTIKNLVISTRDADSYSLIISGAMGVVDANNLPQGPNADDTNVPAQIYLAGGTVLPADPSESGSADANVIDQGEF
jgi:hypothetical protein